MATLIRRFADLGEAYEGEPGFEKIRRQRRNFEDEGRDGRGRRENGPQRREDPPQANGDQKKPAVVTPPADGKKEETMQTTAPTKTFRSLQDLKNAPIGPTQNTQNTAPVQDKEPCPVCGDPKFKVATFTVNEGETKTVPVLVCGACTGRYKAYQEGVRVANIKLVTQNPSAPEPAGPVDKFHWVLSQIDLDKFEVEAKAAETAYRAKYAEVVLTVLRQRGYLDGDPEWKGAGTTRPVMRFTRAAFNSGMGPGLRTSLEEGLKGNRWAMKKAVGRLESAGTVKAELEKRISAPPATTVTAAPTTSPATPIAQTTTAKKVVRKPRAKKATAEA